MTNATQWPCRGCGAMLSGRGGKRYCGPDCRPRCSIEGCEKPVHSKDMCSAHGTRASRYGDPLAPKLRGRNAGACSVEGCDQPMRKVGMCASHYSQSRVKGKAKPFKYQWTGPAEPCVMCGSPTPEGRRRRYCSPGCQQASARTGGGRPRSATCDFCGKVFSLGRERTGRLQRIDTKWCPDCGRESPDVQRFRRYGITREQYAAALERGCSICGRTDRTLHVDHDHSCCPMRGGSARTCGKCVRGLICGPCNRGLGLFFDNPDALERAANYLRRKRE